MSDPAGMELREVWGAAPRRNSPRRRQEPTALVLHHTAGTRPTSRSKALDAVLAVQRLHQGSPRNWTDIAYNYVVTPGGAILEGRGGEFRNGANTGRTRNRNADTLSICLLGNFMSDVMTAAEKRAVKTIGRHYGLNVIPHSDLSATACPGDGVRAWLTAGMPLPGGGTANDSEVARAALTVASNAISDALRRLDQ